MPVRTASERLKKSNVFYTSDGNSNDDDLSSSTYDEAENDVLSRKSRNKGASRLLDESDEHASDDGQFRQTSRRGKPQKQDLPTKRPVGRPRKVTNHSFKKYPSSDFESMPAHRKARGKRSKKRGVRLDAEDDDEIRENSKTHTIGALSRSSRTARSQKKYYNEDDSDESDNDDDDEDAEVDVDENNNSESDEESSEEIDDDSEDELITQSLKNGPGKSSQTNKKPNNKSQKRPGNRGDNKNTDSDSDSLVPRKRTRLRASPSKHSFRTRNSQSPSVNKTRHKKAKRKTRDSFSRKDSSKRETRNRGQQRVTYLEDYSDDEDNDVDDDLNSDSDDLVENNVRSISSRGRVRKMTARAKANFKRQIGINSAVFVGK